jgi:hypothetical protein
MEIYKRNNIVNKPEERFTTLDRYDPEEGWDYEISGIVILGCDWGGDRDGGSKCSVWDSASSDVLIYTAVRSVSSGMKL